MINLHFNLFCSRKWSGADGLRELSAALAGGGGGQVVGVGAIGALGYVDSIDGGMRLLVWPVLWAAAGAKWTSDELCLVPFPTLLEEEPVVFLKVELDALHDLVGQGW